jgi:hypothetical protein
MSDQDGLGPEGPALVMKTKNGSIVPIPRQVGGGYVPLANRIHRPPGYVPPKPKQASVVVEPTPTPAPVQQVIEPVQQISSTQRSTVIKPKFQVPVMRKTKEVKALEPTCPVETIVETPEMDFSDCKVEENLPVVQDTAKQVMILRPAYKMTDELVSYVTMALYDKSSMKFEVRRNDAVIFHSRNMLADIFMKSGYEWSLWWDDDMIPSVGNAAWSKANIPAIPKSYPDNYLNLNPIKRLLQHNKSIIGGLYFGRTGRHGAICQRTAEDNQIFQQVPDNSILARKWVGTGFLLVHRSVYESIQAQFPELAPKDSPNHWEKVWDYFRPSEQQAEDVSFCQRALECGHQPYVDLGNVVFHLGNYAYGPWNQI